MEKLDVVYFIKPDLVNNELRYSLRSVENNFPHRYVWFFGGQPIELTPDRRAPIIQSGANRYEKVRNMLRAACENDEITEDFWLFNDDFFVLRPLEDIPAWYDGDLIERFQRIERRRGRQSSYTQQLRRTVEALRNAGYGILNYAVHVPMKINRKKMLQTLDRFPDCPMFRALYGNMHEIGGINAPDVKIVASQFTFPRDACLVSTSDSSFINGDVGRDIRDRFPEKSRWEMRLDDNKSDLAKEDQSGL